MTKMTIDIPTELKNQIKASAAIMGEKMKDYVISALQEKMQRDRAEEKYFGDAALAAEKEGYISNEQSDLLLKDMINPDS